MPYGYKLFNCKHVVNEEEAEVVRMIFEWLVKDRMTMRGIQKRPNEMKIPTRKGTTFWQHEVIYFNILLIYQPRYIYHKFMIASIYLL